jgi:CheY-like chemotaxis protein
MSKTVLVVEDDKLIRDEVVSLLQNAKHTVFEAANGEEGLKKAQEVHPDIILTDLRMPVMDGHQMVEAIRKEEWGQHVPVLILTADDSTTSLNSALQEGVTVYLTKTGLDPEALSDQILMAVGD